MVIAVAPTLVSSHGTSGCKEADFVTLTLESEFPLSPHQSYSAGFPSGFFASHMSPPHSVLLVGEGNFSFSASLCQQLASAATSITATCLQSEDEALRHQGAADNIDIINKLGKDLLTCWFADTLTLLLSLPLSCVRNNELFLCDFVRRICAVRGGLQTAGRLLHSAGSPF